MPNKIDKPPSEIARNGPEEFTPAESGEQDPKSGRQVPQKEIGGPAGPDPTRFGDWEKAGRCIDF